MDVVRIFSELKPRERALLWLAYVEGDTHADIAASLRLGRGSIKVLLSRARARLRDLLTSRGAGGKVGEMTRSGSDVTPAEERTITGVHAEAPRCACRCRLECARRGRAVAQGAAHPAVGTRNDEFERPIDLMEPIEIAAGIAAAALLLFWSVPSAFDWLPRLMF